MTRRPRPAFALIELPAVIAVIAVPIGPLLPAIQDVRESAPRTRRQNTLKQLEVAVRISKSARRATPPPGTHVAQLPPLLEQRAPADL